MSHISQHSSLKSVYLDVCSTLINSVKMKSVNEIFKNYTELFDDVVKIENNPERIMALIDLLFCEKEDNRNITS